MSDDAEWVRAAEEHLAASFIRLTHERPYLGAALWALRRVIVPPRENVAAFTMAVSSRWELSVDARTVLSWGVPETATILYHEVLHLLRGHAERRPLTPDNHELWNIVADAEINDDLRDEGLPFPLAPILPETLKQRPHQLAERYWEALVRDGWQGDVDYQPSSAATGVPQPWESDDPGIGPDEAQAIREQVARETQEHVRRRGWVPDHLQRWAEAQLNPQVDWRQELSSLLRNALGALAGRVDYSYQRPSRRQSVYGKIIPPVLRQPPLEIAVVVDTSGSMSDDDLTAALTELDGVLRAGLAQSVKVVTVDAAVQASQHVFSANQVTLTGGGGTDMTLGLETALALRPRPTVVIVLTDGYTTWPEIPPVAATVIVVLTQPEQASNVPAWAQALVLPERR